MNNAPPTTVAPPRSSAELLADLERRARAGDASAAWLRRILAEGQRAVSGGRVKEDSPGPN
jgi:hypothetical protein